MKRKKKEKEKIDLPDESTKQNSMAPEGKINSAGKEISAGPEEFEEQRSMKLRMKPQPYAGQKKVQNKSKRSVRRKGKS